MDVLETNYVIIAALIVIGILIFIIGYKIGCNSLSPNGSILLDKNEDGDDRIIFNLGMEYDDISNYDQVVFKVINKKAM